MVWYSGYMSDEPESLVLRLLREMRADMADMRADMRANMATKAELADVKAELRSEMHSLRVDVVSDITLLRKDLGDQIAGLRRAVTHYHSSVVGHGVLITELEDRVRRVEQHLDCRQWISTEGR